MSLAGSVILALLGGLGVAVVAQGDADAALEPPTQFSGRFVCCDDFQQGPIRPVLLGSTGEGDLIRREVRGMMRSTGDEMSDPRFNGTYSIHMAGDEYVYEGVDTSDHPMLITGLLRIENDEGAWQGSAPDAYLPDGPEVTWGMMVLTGEGAYEGLTVAFWSRLVDDQCFPGDPDNPCVHDVRGLVFEGEMPPVPSRAE
jgi:hypothetical protein